MLERSPQREVLLDAASSLADLVRRDAPEAERAGKLTAAVDAALRAARLYDAFIPKELGGLGVDPLTLLEIAECVSAHDGSAGWCLGTCGMIGGFAATRLPESGVREVFAAGPGVVLAGGYVPRCSARAVAGGYRVSGRMPFASGCRNADALIVTTDAGLVLVPRPDAGWNAQSLEALDHAQRFAAVTLDAAGTPLADSAASAPVLAACARLSAFGAAALMLGLVERSLEMAVSYTMERQAFGAPLASFQALQHREADMFLQTEATRAAVYRAAWAADSSPGEAPLLIAVAKVQAGEAGRKVCGENIQLHGGVGYTWEYDPHIYFKRIKTLEHFYGPVRDQLEAVLEARGV